MKRLSKSERGHQAASQDDDAWFEAHPNRTHRVRRPHEIELSETRPATGTPASALPYVIVRQVQPGFRLRMLIWSVIEVPDAEATGHALFDLSIRQPLGRPLTRATVAALELKYARGGRA
jgi:hypothetical protein